MTQKELVAEKKKSALHQLKPHKNVKLEEQQLKAKPTTANPLKTDKIKKTGKNKTGKNITEEKKPSNQILGNKEKKDNQILSLKEVAEYTGDYEVIERLGPVFGPDKKKQDYVSRIYTGSPDLDPVIEFDSDGPYYDPGSSHRNYGMVQRLNQFAITLQFHDLSSGTPIEMQLRDLKAAHTTSAGGGWIVTKADIDENAKRASVNIAKERYAGVLSLGQRVDDKDYIVQLRNIDQNGGGNDEVNFNILDKNSGTAVGFMSVLPGETTTFGQPSTGKQIKMHVWNISDDKKSAEVSILSEEHYLGQDEGFDNGDVDQFRWNYWYAAFGTGGMQKNKKIGTYDIDFSSNTVSVYVDDLTAYNNGDARFKKGDVIYTPLGYMARCDGMVNDWKNDIKVTSEGQTSIQLGKEISPGVWDGNTPGEVITKDLMGVKSQIDDFFINQNSRMRDFKIDPKEKKTYAKLPGTGYYLPMNGDMNFDDDALDKGKISFTQNTLGFSEAARNPGTLNIDDWNVYSAVSFKYDSGNYKFKDSSMFDIAYTGLNQNQNSYFEDYLMTERGSDWKIESDYAQFRFNVGGNEPGITDGMARFKWSVLNSNNQQTFENPLEFTNGGTKNGIYGYWRYPNYAIIPSPNNNLFQDATAEYHIYSTKGTEFHFLEQGFWNQVDYLGYKITPKNGWVVNQSVVPIFGTECKLTGKDDVNKIWEITDINGEKWTIDGKNGWISPVGGPGGHDQYWRAYVGDRARVDQLDMPDKLKGNDILWIVRQTPAFGPFVADSGPFGITQTASLELKQQKRTQSIGLEIVKNKDFGSIGTKDAIKIDISKLNNINEIGDATLQFRVNTSEIQELYLIPTNLKVGNEKYAQIDVIYKNKVGVYVENHTDSNPDDWSLRHELVFSDKSGGVLRLRQEGGNGIAINFVVIEQVGDNIDTHTGNTIRWLDAETTMHIATGPNTDPNRNHEYTSINKIQTDGIFELADYYLDLNTNTVSRNLLESYTQHIPNTKYNARGTQIITDSEATHVTFNLFDNSTHPTVWTAQETYSKYEKFKPVPIEAPFEYTKGGTKIGYFNYLELPWFTNPVCAIMPSTHSDQFQANVQKAEYQIYSPLGTMFDPSTTAITNTTSAVGYHLGLEHEPNGKDISYLFDRNEKLVQVPTPITDFLPMPSNEDVNYGTKMYGFIGSLQQMKAEDLELLEQQGRDYL